MAGDAAQQGRKLILPVGDPQLDSPSLQWHRLVIPALWWGSRGNGAILGYETRIDLLQQHETLSK